MNLFPLAGLNVVVLAVLVVAGIALVVLGWERYRPARRPVHALPTSEVFVDPETQRRLRVWVDPVTGAREYREDGPRSTRLPPLARPGLHVPEAPSPSQLPPAPDAAPAETTEQR